MIYNNQDNLNFIIPVNDNKQKNACKSINSNTSDNIPQIKNNINNSTEKHNKPLLLKNNSTLEMKCDLQPRVNKKGSKMLFNKNLTNDSNNSNQRQEVSGKNNNSNLSNNLLNKNDSSGFNYIGNDKLLRGLNCEEMINSLNKDQIDKRDSKGNIII